MENLPEIKSKDAFRLPLGEVGRGFEIILASKSPRRQQLLSDLGLKFKVQSMDTPEDFPDGMKMTEIPVFLAELKASAFIPQLKANQLVILSLIYTSDAADEEDSVDLGGR